MTIGSSSYACRNRQGRESKPCRRCWSFFISKSSGLPLRVRTSSWSGSLRWLESIRPIITRRAYSGFCLGVVGSRAAQEGAYTAFPELLYRAFRNGSPGLWHVLPFLAYWLTPQEFRRLLRGMLRRRFSPRSA